MYLAHFILPGSFYSSYTKGFEGNHNELLEMQTFIHGKVEPTPVRLYYFLEDVSVRQVTARGGKRSLSRSRTHNTCYTHSSRRTLFQCFLS